MFKKVSKAEAAAAAKMLIRPICTGVATYVINENWHAEMCILNSSAYLLTLYEHMNDEIGFIKSRQYAFGALDESVLAEVIYVHIEGIVAEWNAMQEEEIS